MSNVGDSVGSALGPLDGRVVGATVGLNVSPVAVGTAVVGDIDGAMVVALSQLE